MSKFSRTSTVNELFAPAMQITDQTEAETYFDELVSFTVLIHGKTRIEAEALTRKNLAYFAGYYDDAVRERVERLFKCEHPVFGSIAANGSPSAEKAFNLGLAMGKSVS